MLRLSFRVVGKPCLLLLLIPLAANPALAQLETATVSGQVVDPSGLSITGAQVKLVDIDRETTTNTATNPSGLYTFPSVRPGRYRIEVTVAGFKVVNVTGLTVNVQDHLEQNFKLAVGSVSESVTVQGGAPLVDTESATVSTVVDRNFAENLPMNGRSFQTLIQLTPGVVLVPSNSFDSGQFTVNGQRAASNYWMVDGVSANIGIGTNSFATPGNGLSGALGSFSVLGGTNSLVSVDALQEFRIQTSTYAPEFGRTPGGQISIVTRSGTNQFHGTLFDYFRNDILDANDWFNGWTQPPLPKAKERQNDFGGVFGGPIIKNRTFFFFSYEGLRLRLPQTILTTVPDLNARQSAASTAPAVQPFLNAYPLPNGIDDIASGEAEFNASFSNPATLDAYSIRVDHKLNDNLTVFGRYNYSPSDYSQRAGFSLSSPPASSVNHTHVGTQTATVGVTWLISPKIAEDLRFNYSRTSNSSFYSLDNFGGATPLASLPFPQPYSSQNGLLQFAIFSLKQGFLEDGQNDTNLQRQVNFVENLSLQKGTHQLKFGVDYRRLSPQWNPFAYQQTAAFLSVSSAVDGNPYLTEVLSNLAPTFLFRNLGAYAQDTWRASSRMTITYGLRWDLDFVPRAISGPNFPAVTGFSLTDFSNLALAPPGTPPYETRYGNVAPRIGLAYQVDRNQEWETVLHGGFGVFYDLATSEMGNNIGTGYYPFGSSLTTFGGSFPPASLTPPPITSASISSPTSVLFAFDPKLELPDTLEWNFAVEQALGRQQTVSASYIGAAGRRLLQTAAIGAPNSNISNLYIVTNAGTSEYDALQLQFQRRLSHGLQALASYTWSHSIDTGSAGSTAVLGNSLVPSSVYTNRGPSDFDIRHAFSAGLTYDFPTTKINSFLEAILSNWSTENIIQARSAPPVDISDFYFTEFDSGFYADVRPDLVPGQPLYLVGSECASVFQGLGSFSPGQGCPGGKGFNPAAFTDPPVDPTTSDPARQGTTPRNFLRGFGATQWDFAVRRDFPLHESLKLQFRAEMFNVLNHPNFGPPSGAFLSPANGGPAGFGWSSQMLGQSLNSGNLGGGAFSPLYQIGGPRSIQFALKLTF